MTFPRYKSAAALARGGVLRVLTTVGIGGWRILVQVCGLLSVMQCYQTREVPTSEDAPSLVLDAAAFALNPIGTLASRISRTSILDHLAPVLRLSEGLRITTYQTLLRCCHSRQLWELRGIAPICWQLVEGDILANRALAVDFEVDTVDNSSLPICLRAGQSWRWWGWRQRRGNTAANAGCG